jgi:hypothetical protein
LKHYQNHYPENYIVLIGDQNDTGTSIGTSFIEISEGAIGRICLLKGGIDAVKVEHPELLRKGSNSQA